MFSFTIFYFKFVALKGDTCFYNRCRKLYFKIVTECKYICKQYELVWNRTHILIMPSYLYYEFAINSSTFPAKEKDNDPIF